jgi:hypothetical protein
MPFAYYSRLSAAEQATYRESAAVTALRVPGARALWPAVEVLRRALERDDRGEVQRASAVIAGALSVALGADAPRVQVLAVRPRFTEGELHGLYTAGPRQRPLIRVWMRTARHARVVAFRTFLRTLLHELCHHLDLAVLGLSWSFHTEGFFKRESSFFHQLVPEARAGGRDTTPEPASG